MSLLSLSMLTGSGCSSNYTGIQVFRFCPKSLFRNSFVKTLHLFLIEKWLLSHYDKDVCNVSFVLLFWIPAFRCSFVQSWMVRSMSGSAEISLYCFLLSHSANKEYCPAALMNLWPLLWCCANYSCVPPLDGLLPRKRMFLVIVAENADSRIRQEALARVCWQKMESVCINTARMPPNAASIPSLRPNRKLERLC